MIIVSATMLVITTAIIRTMMTLMRLSVRIPITVTKTMTMMASMSFTLMRSKLW